MFDKKISECVMKRKNNNEYQDEDYCLPVTHIRRMWYGAKSDV
jgi:hypothetical protein